MYINSYGQVVSDDYLAHHGILGQKWGQRNGPPYPLDANAHSAAEKRLKGKNDGKLESWKKKRREKSRIVKAEKAKLAKVDNVLGQKYPDLLKKSKSIALERKVAEALSVASGISLYNAHRLRRRYEPHLLFGKAIGPNKRPLITAYYISTAALLGTSIALAVHTDKRTKKLMSDKRYKQFKSLRKSLYEKYGYPKGSPEAFDEQAKREEEEYDRKRNAKKKGVND